MSGRPTNTRAKLPEMPVVVSSSAIMLAGVATIALQVGLPHVIPPRPSLPNLTNLEAGAMWQLCPTHVKEIFQSSKTCNLSKTICFLLNSEQSRRVSCTVQVGLLANDEVMQGGMMTQTKKKKSSKLCYCQPLPQPDQTYPLPHQTYISRTTALPQTELTN